MYKRVECKFRVCKYLQMDQLIHRLIIFNSDEYAYLLIYKFVFE